MTDYRLSHSHAVRITRAKGANIGPSDSELAAFHEYDIHSFHAYNYHFPTWQQPGQ